jgi:hypothetical protein
MSNIKVRDYLRVLGDPHDKYVFDLYMYPFTHLFSKFSNNQVLIYIRALHKVTFSFTPYPLFQWFSPSDEIHSWYEMPKLSI